MANVASSIAVLRVKMGEADSLSYTLRVHGDDREHPGQAPMDIARLRAIAGRGRGPETGDAEGLDAARGTRLEAPSLPGALGRRLRQWTLSGDAGQTLCVSCDDGILWDLPWESLPSALGIEHLAIVRLAGAGVQRPPSRPGRPTALIAAWPRHRDRVLPGITRELQALSERFRDAYLPVTALPEPTIDQLRDVCRDLAPALIHLAHAGVERSGPGEELRLQVPDEEGGV